MVVDVSDSLFKTAQKRTDDLDIPTTLVETFNTDFSYLPIVLDFKHRSTPAALFKVEFAQITASNLDTDLEDVINAAFTNTVAGSSDYEFATIGADVYVAAQFDHPLFYMCLKTYNSRENFGTYVGIIADDDETAELYDDPDGTRKQICNIDLNGYIGDLSIFNTGGVTFGNGLIYEDRVFINREIFSGKSFYMYIK